MSDEWTTSEDELLRHAWWMHPRLLQKNGLPHRSVDSITRRKRTLGLRHRDVLHNSIHLGVRVSEEQNEMMMLMIEDGEDGPTRQDIMRRALDAYLADVEI